MKTKSYVLTFIAALFLFSTVKVSHAIECVQYVREQTGLGSYGPNAYDWAGKHINGYKWHKNDGDRSKPGKGDIIVWRKGPNRLQNGHVAIINNVIKIDSKRYSIRLSEANWSKLQSVTTNRLIDLRKKGDKYYIEADYVAGWHEKK